MLWIVMFAMVVHAGHGAPVLSHHRHLPYLK